MLMAGQSVGISLVPWRDGMSSEELKVGCVCDQVCCVSWAGAMRSYYLVYAHIIYRG